MKTPLLYHLKPTWWQSIHKWRSFRTSKCYQGWNFSKYTRAIRTNFWKKIIGNSKIYPLGIMKILLFYHWKPAWWQSMHKWRSFRTSNFTLMLPGLKFFHKHTKIQFLEKNKMKFKNVSPGNHENPIASSYKANFMTIHA